MTTKPWPTDIEAIDEVDGGLRARELVAVVGDADARRAVLLRCAQSAVARDARLGLFLSTPNPWPLPRRAACITRDQMDMQRLQGEFHVNETGHLNYIVLENAAAIARNRRDASPGRAEKIAATLRWAADHHAAVVLFGMPPWPSCAPLLDAADRIVRVDAAGDLQVSTG